MLRGVNKMRSGPWGGMYVCGVVHIRKRGKGEKRGGIRYRVGGGVSVFLSYLL